jgi:type VI secretion system secreted protein Hcp
MAVNAYLVVAGRPGGSKSKADAIDILSFSFGASQSGTIGVGDGTARAGRANVQDVTIMKTVDKVSPLLFDDCVTGNYLATVDVIYDKPTGDAQEDYYKIHMEDVIISSIQHSGSSENPMESISFSYSKIKVSYNPEEDGALKGFIDKGFDVLTSKPW